MEMSKRTHIKNMRYEDFKDNEYLEQYVEELRKGGAPVVVTRLSDMINWGRSHSVWPLTFATSCCGIEFMCVGGAIPILPASAGRCTATVPVRPMSSSCSALSCTRWPPC